MLDATDRISQQSCGDTFFQVFKEVTNSIKSICCIPSIPDEIQEEIKQGEREKASTAQEYKIKIKSFGQQEIEELNGKSGLAARKRSQTLFHERPAEPVQRFFNGMQLSTFVPVHKHCGEHRWEIFILVTGSAVGLTFDDDGKVIDRVVLTKDNVRAIEIPANTFHTVACLEKDTILFECKYGTYNPTTDKVFAPWCLQESEKGTEDFEKWFRSATVGDSLKSFFETNVSHESKIRSCTF